MHNQWQFFLKDYSSPLQPNDAPHHLVDLSDYGLLKVSGLDAKKFLQGQLTCNVEEVTALEVRMGAHCNPQGRVISLFHLLQFQNAYYLLMPRLMVTITLTALKKYALFYKTELTDESDNLIIIGYSGPLFTPEMQSSPNMANIASIPLTHHHSQHRLFMGELEPMKTLWKKLAEQTALSTLAAWKLLTVSAGIPIIYPETTGKFLPHDINLQTLGAISFDKGCYTGQEIIARMHYRGKLKNHLYHTTITHPSPLLPGTEIYSLQGMEKRTSAIVVYAAPETSNHYAALIVAEESNAKNNHLFLNRDTHAFFTIK